MITVQNILDDSYRETSATTDYKAGNTLGLRHLHEITQDIWSRAVKLKKANKNWDIWYANTVALQNEYTLPFASSDDVGASEIETLSIAYTSDVYPTGDLKYIPCRQAMDYHIQNWEYYLANQDQNDPLYFERDGSYFIAPEPRTADVGIGRIKVSGIRSIASGTWTVSTTESQMKLPLSMMIPLKKGLNWQILAWHNRDAGIVVNAMTTYEKLRDEAIANMFTQTPFINEFPR